MCFNRLCKLTLRTYELSRESGLPGSYSLAGVFLYFIRYTFSFKCNHSTIMFSGVGKSDVTEIKVTQNCTHINLP